MSLVIVLKRVRVFSMTLQICFVTFFPLLSPSHFSSILFFSSPSFSFLCDGNFSMCASSSAHLCSLLSASTFSPTHAHTRVKERRRRILFLLLSSPFSPWSPSHTCPRASFHLAFITSPALYYVRVCLSFRHAFFFLLLVSHFLPSILPSSFSFSSSSPSPAEISMPLLSLPSPFFSLSLSFWFLLTRAWANGRERESLFSPSRTFFFPCLSHARKAPLLALLCMSSTLLAILLKERGEKRDERRRKRESRKKRESNVFFVSSDMTDAIWGERNKINGLDSSKLKPWYLTILMKLGAEVLWAWSSFQVLRIC